MRKRKGATALDAALRGMFKVFEDRGVPEHVLRVVDQLDEAVDAVKPSPAPPPSPEP